MSSKLWTQSIEDTVAHPYDYESQQGFLKEARVLLDQIYGAFDRYQLKFHIDDRSVKKAVWMLQIDALDTLRDCIDLLDRKKHRIVGKMFRDVIETLDLAALFWHQGDNNRTDLQKWYNDEIIPHKRYREFLKSHCGPEASNRRRDFYKGLSQWTHHTYYTLKNSYSLSAGNMLVYDSHSEILILPHTISQYMWMVSELIKLFIGEVRRTGLIAEDDLRSAWHEATKE